MTTNYTEHNLPIELTSESPENLDRRPIRDSVALLALGVMVTAAAVTGKLAYDTYEDLKNPEYHINIIDGINK